MLEIRRAEPQNTTDLPLPNLTQLPWHVYLLAWPAVATGPKDHRHLSQCNKHLPQPNPIRNFPSICCLFIQAGWANNRCEPCWKLANMCEKVVINPEGSPSVRCGNFLRICQESSPNQPSLSGFDNKNHGPLELECNVVLFVEDRCQVFSGRFCFFWL